MQNDPISFTDPSGLNLSSSGSSFTCIRYHYTNLETGAGFWGDWQCSPNGGGDSGGGGGETNLHELAHSRKDFPCPPSFQDFYKNNQIQDTFDKAWYGSLSVGKERGGWIFMDRKGGIHAVLKDPEATDTRYAVQLGYPPVIPGQIVVATFHTHPDDVGYDPQDEGINNYRDRVPGIIIKEGPPQLVGYGPIRGLWRRDLPKGCK